MHLLCCDCLASEALDLLPVRLYTILLLLRQSYGCSRATFDVEALCAFLAVCCNL